jgi:thiosulfate dehydrogenase
MQYWCILANGRERVAETEEEMALSAKRAGFVVLIIIIVVAVLVGGLWMYLRFGRVPVAVTDTAFPMEQEIVSIPLQARIGREMLTPPIAASEAAFVAGANSYVEECAVCHGTPGTDSVYAKSMYPAPPQLWKKHGTHGVVGVSDDDAGRTYWVVKNGVRLTGMPAFADDMSDQKLWQIALLLKNADKDMPASVSKILSGSPQ